MGPVLTYFQELAKDMTMLSRHPRTLFVGQGVKFDGQRMFRTFSGVHETRRIELPVAEDFQMGFCTGLSLEGFIPISVYPRMDFLILAMNQLVNHLDKIERFQPKVIIRVAVGSSKPLDPGPQHRQDHVEALSLMLKNIPVVEYGPGVYEEALNGSGSVIVVERMERYDS